MTRFDNSPELFGGGAGTGTGHSITCGLCKTNYNEDIGPSNPIGGDTVNFTRFAGIQVCDCCFENIETAVLKRMDYILYWYNQILDDRLDRILKHKKLVRQIADGKKKIEKEETKLESEG